MVLVTALIMTTFTPSVTVRGTDTVTIRSSWIHGHFVRVIPCGLDWEHLVAPGDITHGGTETGLDMATIGVQYPTVGSDIPGTVMATVVAIMVA